MSISPPHRSVRRFFPLFALSAALIAPAAWAAPAEDAAVPSRLDAIVAGVGEKVSGVVDGVVKPAAGVVGTALDSTMGVVGGAVDVVQEGSGRLADSATALVGQALDLLGVRYRRGGTSVESGFDCSGFVKNVYEGTLGLVLPRSAAQQAAVTQKIDVNDLQPGDLVFFNTMRRAFSHAGIYIGNGEFVHAPRTGASVRVDRLDLAYWKRRFNGARRVVPDKQAL